MRTSVTYLLLGAAAGAACSSPTVCDPCTTSGIAYGTVRDSTGAPLIRVFLTIDTYLISCGHDYRAGEYAYTDSLGRYRSRVRSLYSPHTAHCFRVTVNPDSDTRWPTGNAEFSGTLEFRFEENESRLDSIRLDVTLGRGGGE